MKSWREILKVHPAAELFPPMGPDELKALGEDIKKNGLRHPIVLWSDTGTSEIMLIDGRNRLAGMELAGMELVRDNKLNLQGNLYYRGWNGLDPYDYVISANIHRRHLATAAQRGELTEKVLKAKSEWSDRQIAKIAKVDHKTVGAKRKALEAGGEIPHHDMRVGKDGVAQPIDKRPTIAQQRALKALEADKAQGLPDPLAEPEKPAGSGTVRINVQHYETPINIPHYIKSGSPSATQATANATSTGELPIGDTLNLFRGNEASVEPRDDRPWTPRSKKFAVIEGRIRGMLSSDLQDELQRFINGDKDKVDDAFPESLGEALWDLADKACQLADNIRAKKPDIRLGIGSAS